MWEAFKDLIFACINFFYNFFQDWGMAIVVVTIIFRVLIAPLMQKQIKSSFQMQKVQPRMKEIQTKYADDPTRMQEEMQKIYADAGFNPLAGCLPILLQMPIFMALFQVLQNMGERTQGTNYQFYNIINDLTLSPSTAWDQGWGTFLPYGILLLLFAGATFLPTILQQRNSSDEQQKRQMMIMMAFMSLFMLWIGWASPAGVLLFWATSSILGIAQQQITMHILKKEDEAAEAEVIDVKPVEVDVTRKVKKKRPTKKSK